jgi:asparagine synthase (glutamine-hydrolysing)
MAIDGSFYQHPSPSRLAKEILEKGPLTSAARRIMLEPGGFALLATRGRKILAFRDPNGLKPLYFARRRSVTAFASEKKALWRIGFSKIDRVIPGTVCAAEAGVIRQASVMRLGQIRERSIAFEQARLELARWLRRSMRIITKRLGKVAVAFSGGLDSAVSATLAKSLLDVELVSVGLAGSPELNCVEQYARMLDLPLTVETYQTDALETYVRRIVWLIEEPSLMKVGVAIPLHWAAMLAARMGHGVMLCGQGSDELYGGYYKYARTLASKGRRALRAELHRSVVESAEVNYERDEQATCPSGVELRTPFSDGDVTRFSLSIPSEFKVRDGNDLIRKWILRAAARDMGVPESIVWRRKKAIQHGTGVEKAILKLAKQRNLTAKDYLEKIHAEVRGMESMP